MSSQDASEGVVKEHLYKVLVIGEFGVGKYRPVPRSTHAVTNDLTRFVF